MQIHVSHGDISRVESDALVVNLFEGVQSPAGGTGAVDAALGGVIAQALSVEPVTFKGKLGDTLVLPTYGKLPARYVVLVGLGKSDALTGASLRRASAAAVRTCRKLKAASVATLLHGAGVGGFDVTAAARLLSEGALLGGYRFTQRKGKPKTSDGVPDADAETSATAYPASLTIVEQAADRVPAIEQGVHQGKIIAEHVNLARDWVNDSANYVTPTFLKQQAEAIPGLQCTVLDRAQIQANGMGLFELVAQGSDQPPYLIHLCYTPKNPPQKTIALVGKGITFDSGGLSIKPAGSMETMKMDMAGAAAVIATMKALAALGNDLSVAVHGFVPTCENMVSGHSSRPGDIATAMNGKTVEVNNTDAEGRLILADALTYAQQQCQPDELIDLATLTGACIVALGKAAAGIMGTDDDLIARLRQAGEAAGEKFWPLPLYDEYKSFLKSDVADLINSGAKGEAGSSAGGMFLREFVDADRAWAHLDIAGPAWAGTDQPEVPKGGTGFAVRTLLYYLYGLTSS